MMLNAQGLEVQLSIVDLLTSMLYAPGEIEIDDENLEIISTLRDCLEAPESSVKTLGNVEMTINLGVGDNQKVVISVILHLQAAATASSTTFPPLVQMSIKHPSWLSRNLYEELMLSLPVYDGSSLPNVQGAEDGRDWLLHTIERLQSESTISKLVLASSDLTIPTTSTKKAIDPEQPVTRAWFYLPSLSTRSKRSDMINLAPSHSITGFVLAGKPGLLCIESPVPLGPDAFIAQIKTESWADIPSHQKKITERHREMNVKRAFDRMEEVTEMISTRGARANRGDMGEVRVFLEERGLKGVLEVVLGANEFK